MGSETFEATVADDKTGEPKRLYYGLVRGGMERDSAMALVDSLYPDSVTMTFVEHTGVFGLWHGGIHKWLTDGVGRIVFGPRCVMEAELGSVLEVAPLYFVVEFGINGAPILEDTDYISIHDECPSTAKGE